MLLVKTDVVDAARLPAEPRHGAVPSEELLGVEAWATIRHEYGRVHARPGAAWRLSMNLHVHIKIIRILDGVGGMLMFDVCGQTLS